MESNSRKDQKPIIMTNKLDDSDRRYIGALICIRESNFEKARYLLSLSLKENPRDFDCLLLMAECCLKVGDMLQALLAAKMAYKVEPANPLSLGFLGMIYSRLFLHELAVDFLTRSRKAGDQQEETFFYLSNSYFFLRQNDLAFSVLKEALDLNPSWSRLRHQLGLLYLFENEKAKAEEIALELSKMNYPPAYDLMKIILEDSPERDRILMVQYKEKAEQLLKEAENDLRAERHNQAIQKLIGALQSDDESALAYTLLGKVLDDYGLVDEGFYLHRMAIKIDPDLAAGYINLAYALRMKGEYAPAIEAYEKALEMDPANIETHNSLGHLYDSLGDYRKGLSYFQRALELDPQRLATLMNIGYAHRELGNMEAALKAYRMVREYHPEYCRSRYFMGDIYLEMEDYEKAEDILREAIAIEPESLWGWLKLAECFKALGQDEKFQAALGKVISLPPKDPYEIFFVAKVMEEIDTDRAIRYYQNFLHLAERIPIDPSDVAHVKSRLYALLGPSN